jgi:hypothetical protein
VVSFFIYETVFKQVVIIEVKTKRVGINSSIIPIDTCKFYWRKLISKLTQFWTLIQYLANIGIDFMVLGLMFPNIKSCKKMRFSGEKIGVT